TRKSLKYVYDRTFQESYDCKLTKQIIGFNVVTGKWDYNVIEEIPTSPIS
ncbi:MAG: hypothetical protein JRH20_23180, partial [Deltaproteobacteria bacterium]|nr:hypothetical protein [Deltaproteobacteria bacterium]